MVSATSLAIIAAAAGSPTAAQRDPLFGSTPDELIAPLPSPSLRPWLPPAQPPPPFLPGHEPCSEGCAEEYQLCAASYGNACREFLDAGALDDGGCKPGCILGLPPAPPPPPAEPAEPCSEECVEEYQLCAAEYGNACREFLDDGALDDGSCKPGCILGLPSAPPPPPAEPAEPCSEECVEDYQLCAAEYGNADCRGLLDDGFMDHAGCKRGCILGP